jgi:hypothetical protein
MRGKNRQVCQQLQGSKRLSWNWREAILTQIPAMSIRSGVTTCKDENELNLADKVKMRLKTEMRQRIRVWGLQCIEFWKPSKYVDRQRRYQVGCEWATQSMRSRRTSQNLTESPNWESPKTQNRQQKIGLHCRRTCKDIRIREMNRPGSSMTETQFKHNSSNLQLRELHIATEIRSFNSRNIVLIHNSEEND